MVTEQVGHSQKYSFVGWDCLSAGPFSRLKSLPSERYRNGCAHDGLQHFVSIKPSFNSSVITQYGIVASIRCLLYYENSPSRLIVAD
jgi:hypothetical protein